MKTTQEPYKYALSNIPLKTTPEIEYALNQTRRALNDCHNALVKHAISVLKQLENDKTYNKLLTELKKCNRLLNDEKRDLSEKAIKDLEKRAEKARKELKNIRKDSGLTENDFQKWINEKRKKKYSKILNADACQKEATRVWRGAQKILFSNGDKLHYRKWDDFSTIGSKKANCNVVPVRNVDGVIYAIKWRGYTIPFKRELNDFELTALESDIRYVEIKFVMFPDGYHYYAIFSLEGCIPLKHERGTGKCGVDPGTSTMSFTNNTETAQVLLAPNAEDYDKQIKELSRRIDESIRATNPDRFNEDGTYKRRKPGESKRWVLSSHCKYMKRVRKMLYRKKSETTKMSHTCLANRIIQECEIINTEPMNWIALARRAKLTRDDKGRYKKRKRYGKSISSHAPGEFLSILKWKCQLYDVDYREVDQWKFRASQLNHITGECIKMPLSKRWKSIGGYQVQRDLYSSFLLKNADSNGLMPVMKDCLAEFEDFLRMQDDFIVSACVDEHPRNHCFGF